VSARAELAVLAVACALLYLPGIADVPFYTRGEPREGLVVREMLRTSEWLVPTRPDGEPTRKPPLYYWLAATAARLAPVRIEAALRLPSALVATAGTLATWRAARVAFGPAAGLPAALVLASAFEWTRAATSARVDMTLAGVLAVLLALWTVALARERPVAVMPAAAAAALGTLAKGPVALVLPALGASGLAMLRRDRRFAARLRPLPVLGLGAAAAAVWYAFAFRHGGEPFLRAVTRENLLRFVDTTRAGTGHAHGLWYLPTLGLVGLLPWVPLLPLAVRGARRPPRGASRLAAAWALGTLVFFSLAAAKRSVYLLPCFPAVALLVGAAVAAPPAAGAAAVARALATLYAPVALLLAAIAAALALGLDTQPLLARWDATVAPALAQATRGSAVMAALACTSVAGAVAVERARRRDDWTRMVLVVAAVAVAWTGGFDALLHPAIARTRSLAPFMTRVSALVAPDAQVYAIFPPDPGLRFYAPRPLRRWPPPADGVARPALLWDDEWRRLPSPPTPLAASEPVAGHHGRLLLVETAAPVRTGSRSP
jgi:4-amino-4-deoxy-L-arabinose transferase-like glycosyltransferase